VTTARSELLERYRALPLPTTKDDRGRPVCPSLEDRRRPLRRLEGACPRARVFL